MICLKNQAGRPNTAGDEAGGKRRPRTCTACIELVEMSDVEVDTEARREKIMIKEKVKTIKNSVSLCLCGKGHVSGMTV